MCNKVVLAPNELTADYYIFICEDIKLCTFEENCVILFVNLEDIKGKTLLLILYGYCFRNVFERRIIIHGCDDDCVVFQYIIYRSFCLHELIFKAVVETVYLCVTVYYNVCNQLVLTPNELTADYYVFVCEDIKLCTFEENCVILFVNLEDIKGKTLRSILLVLRISYRILVSVVACVLKNYLFAVNEIVFIAVTLYFLCIVGEASIQSVKTFGCCITVSVCGYCSYQLVLRIYKLFLIKTSVYVFISIDSEGHVWYRKLGNAVSLINFKAEWLLFLSNLLCNCGCCITDYTEVNFAVNLVVTNRSSLLNECKAMFCKVCRTRNFGRSLTLCVCCKGINNSTLCHKLAFDINIRCSDNVKYSTFELDVIVYAIDLFNLYENRSLCVDELYY